MTSWRVGIRTGWVIIMLAVCSTSWGAPSTELDKEKRVKLVFVADQGIGDGLVVAGDRIGMHRICEALKPLQTRYDVYVLFGPHVKNKVHLDALLDVAVNNGIPFMFDVLSSDAMALGGTPQTDPPDDAHGVEISLEDLAGYKQRYGASLAGIRFMEVMGQAFTALEIATRHPEWMHEGYSRMPDADVDVFNADIVRPYLQFAQHHGMFVQWSEFSWGIRHFPERGDADPAARREAALEGLLAEFPDLVTVTYANNEPEEGSRPQLMSWHEKVAPFVKAGAKDFGLSNQAWLYNLRPMECPVGDLIRWTERALELGCTYIEYEPVFYFFNLPIPHTLTPSQPLYTANAAFADRGEPRSAFQSLRDYLLDHAQRHGLGDPSNGHDHHFRPIRVDNGLFVYPDGSEVALFGTNYYPNCWHQYENMKVLGVDFRDAIGQDLADMKACGIEIVRGMLFDREAADADGNLMPNQHLAVFDILVDELNRQGLYLDLAALFWGESPDPYPGAYPARYTKMAMMFDDEAIACSARFTEQLLNHVNPHTGRSLKNEPCLAVIEIFSEPWYFPYEAVSDAQFDPGFLAWQTDPEVYQRDLAHWQRLWHAWLAREQCDPGREAYDDFQFGVMRHYLDRMIDVIRGTGAQQPIAGALFETWSRNKGIRRAIGASRVDAVTEGWYPGGFDQFNEAENQLAYAPEYPHTGPQAYTLPDEVRHKAKMVYEFDVCRTYDNVTLYPQMIRHFRSMGAQIIMHFQYDAAATARFQTDWGVHFLNFEASPAKAVAFIICSELTRAIPRGEQYEVEEENILFHNTAVSFEHMQVMRVADGVVLHAHPIGEWRPLPLPPSPKRIVGRGDSPYIQYDGTGLYMLEQATPDLIRLRATPNTTLLAPMAKEFFDTGRLDRPLVALDVEPRRFRLLLPGWEDFTCATEQGEECPVEDRAANVVPGTTYLLRRQPR